VVVSIIHERFSPRRQHNIWHRRGHCAVWSGDFPSIPKPPRRASPLTSHSRRPAQAGDCVRRPELVSTHRLVCRMGGRNVGSRSRKRGSFITVAEEKTLASTRSSNDRSETRWTELLYTTLHYATLHYTTLYDSDSHVRVGGCGRRGAPKAGRGAAISTWAAGTRNEAARRPPATSFRSCPLRKPARPLRHQLPSDRAVRRLNRPLGGIPVGGTGGTGPASARPVVETLSM
jgi:hypothetical protein